MAVQKSDSGCFTHPAFFYGSEQEYLDRLAPFISGGLAAGQPVFVAVPTDKLALLRGELGGGLALLELADITEAGRNPASMLGHLLAFADKFAGQPVRLIGEPVWPGRSPDEYLACLQHEALVNTAFAGRDVTAVCPYDVRGLSAEVLDDARMTHPVLWKTGGADHRSRTYSPDLVWDKANQPLTTSPTAIVCIVRTVQDLTRLRAFAADYAGWLGLSANAKADLLLVVNELALTSLRRGGAPCRLGLWRQDGRIICEARDRAGLGDRLAGRRPYLQDDAGRGLFVVNALTDLVRIHTTATATTVQAHLGWAA